MLISLTGDQTESIFVGKCFEILVFPKLFSTLLKLNCLKSIFYMINHIDLVVSFMFVETVSR